MIFRTRFAPSPTGPLHLGHAFSALTAFDMAQAAGGAFLLRMDDIDQTRSKAEFDTQIRDDLQWLGVRWTEPVMQQTRSAPRVQAALDQLAARGLVYPCSCSRADIETAAGAPQEGVPTHGPDGRIYPGTCRHRTLSRALPGDALRLNLERALTDAHPLPAFIETGDRFAGTHSLNVDDLRTTVGDVALARRNHAMAYHLSVVVDDHAQGITHVVRGEDLFDATRIHVLLAHLLGWPIPLYHHHRLIRDDAGKRLAKRDNARAIAVFREAGASPSDVRKMVGLPPG